MLNTKDLPANILSKEKLPIVSSTKVVNDISNWYSDRYNSIVVQRNLLLVLLLAAVIIVAVSVFVVGNVTSTFKVQPFVIDVEDKTGITDIVNPLANNVLTSSEVLNRYFLMKYINAREGYSNESWEYNYLTVVRLLSSPEVFSQFRYFLNTSANSPIALYKTQKASANVAFRSIQLFPGTETKPGVIGDSQAVIRFTVTADTGMKTHKILTTTYRYEQTEMNEDDRQVNPLGFFITSYRTDIENDNVN